jgi:hypothetical protein
MPKVDIISKRRLLKVALEARMKPELRRFALLHPVAAAIEGYPDWSTSFHQVRLIDRAAHCSLFMSSHEIRHLQDSGERKTERAKVSILSHGLLEKLAVSRLLRMGHRRWYLAELQMSFEEAVDIFRSRYYSENDAVSSLGHRIDDVLYRVDSTDGEGWQWHITFAPVLRAQALELLNYDFDNHWEEDAGTLAARNVRDGLPEVGLHLDLDCYRQGTELPIYDWEEFVARSRDKAEEISAALYASFVEEAGQ